jgi:hypothetical protein
VPVSLTIRRIDGSRLRCALCHDDLSADVLTCSICRTVVHEECLNSWRCPTLACPSWSFEIPRPRRSPWSQAIRAMCSMLFVLGLSLLVRAAMH